MAEIPLKHDPLQWRAKSVNSAGFFDLVNGVIARLPEELSEDLGEIFAYWTGHLLPPVILALRRNLEVVRPGLDGASYERLARQTLVNYALGVKDYLLKSNGRLEGLVMSGAPSPGVRDLMREKKGFILVAAHFGNFELGSWLFRKYNLPATIVALPEEIEAINAMRVKNRQAFGAETLTVGSDLETFLSARKSLDSGIPLAMLVDRHLPKNGVAVDFFGRRCLFLRTPAQLARHAGVPLVPVAAQRVGRFHYHMHCGDPIYLPGTRVEADLAAAMQKTADFFALHISRHPDQWYNFYDYFSAARAAG